jgi:hypothetical protein
MNFNEILNLSNSNGENIMTLGGRSSFKLINDGCLFIKTSTGYEHKISNELWAKVIKRMKELPADEIFMTSRYSYGNHKFNWKNCPNKISPYIPAIVRHFSTSELNNQN